MKKFLHLAVIGILVLSGLGAVALTEYDVAKNELIEKTNFYSLSRPTLYEYGQYMSVELDGATSFEMVPGEPILPKITKVYSLPFASIIKDITVEFSEAKKQVLSKEIRPAPEPLIDGNNDIKTVVRSEEIYSSSELYPDFTYNYRTSVGLNGDKNVVFLTVQCYPVRYSPAKNTLYYSDSVEIKVTYEEPSNPVTFPDEFDLLIIAPSEFEQELQPLIDHKNDHNLNTTLITLEEIYADYIDGRDDPENLKLYIKDAKENWGITYVLLVGGMIGQKNEWYLPVRYASSPSEAAYLSDLYYADIYKIVENETVFEDWDSNGNGIFAEYSTSARDIIDGNPDVHIGRLACRNIDQVTTMVNKIINYEKDPADESWFKHMLLIGGDTYPSTSDGFEAEIDTNVSASYMDGFEFERLWASLGTLTCQEDVEQAISKGAGFIHMAGHANPSILVTYPPHDVEKEHKITLLRMYTIPPLDAMYALITGKFSKIFSNLMLPINPRLNNNEKLPIVLVGGCHNSQFNTTLLNMLTYGINYAYGRGLHVPKCWSWWLTSHESGGAIATIGNTGLGMGLPEFNYPNGLDGWLYPRFFYNYGQLGKEHVGEAHSAAIADYINEFDINKDGEDRQMVQQWALLGDPSLMIGGYQ
jgi:hypothetical protein